VSAIAAIVAALALAAIAVFQVLGAAGRPVGRFLWGGSHRVLPRGLRIGSALSVLLYAAFTVVLLSRAGVLPGGDTVLVHVLAWVLVGYFALGILMNAISRSRPERAVMTPLCVLLAASSLVVALG
jgi:hypothetical protein